VTTLPLRDRPDGAGVGSTAQHDLAFVGAGASTAYVLMGLLAALEEAPPRTPVRIAVIEREPDAFSGIAYGGRAGRASLLITSLHDFLPEGERALFSEWLAANKDWVFDEFLASAGPLSANWWERHRVQIGQDQFDALYLPRHVFGTYLAERTRRALARGAAAGVAVTHVVQDEVCAIESAGDSYLLRCTNGVVRAGRVVLGIGSPPVMPRLPADGGQAAALVDDPFDRTASIEPIRAALVRAAPGARPPHVVLIGGNAGAMDVLYQVNDLDLPEVRRAVFTVLSPRGDLPERMQEAREPHPFRPERLHALQGAEAVDAAGVFHAALDDISQARAAGLSVADTLRPVSQAVGRLLPRLSPEQALEFAGRWGAELGRHQRRAGWEYSEVVDRLAAEGRLHTVAGSFLDVRAVAGGGVLVRFERDGVLADLDLPADAVVNCGGPARDLRHGGSALLAQLIGTGLCRPTPFGGGMAVDASLEAARGLHVMGPLLAGNLVQGAPLWHMEHCGRISAYGSAMGGGLARLLVTG